MQGGGNVPACREARSRVVLEHLRGFNPPTKKMLCILKFSVFRKTIKVLKSVSIIIWPYHHMIISRPAVKCPFHGFFDKRWPAQCPFHGFLGRSWSSRMFICYLTIWWYNHLIICLYSHMAIYLYNHMIIWSHVHATAVLRRQLSFGSGQLFPAQRNGHLWSSRPYTLWGPTKGYLHNVAPSFAILAQGLSLTIPDSVIPMSVTIFPQAIFAW